MEPLTKVCSGKYGCGEERWIEEFRRHATTGGRATYCHDCELEFDRFRRGFPSVFDSREVPVGLVPISVRVEG